MCVKNLFFIKSIKDNIIKSYAKYVDDALLYIDQMLHQFNSFDENLKLTINGLDKFAAHFLGTEMCPNRLSVYHETIQTG